MRSIFSAKPFVPKVKEDDVACISFGEIYIAGLIKSVDFKTVDTKNGEIEVTISMKNIKKLLNGDDNIIGEATIFENDYLSEKGIDDIVNTIVSSVSKNEDTISKNINVPKILQFRKR
jgi:hypothetical protein